VHVDIQDGPSFPDRYDLGVDFHYDVFGIGMVVPFQPDEKIKIGIRGGLGSFTAFITAPLPVKDIKSPNYGLTYGGWFKVEASYCPDTKVGVVRASKFFSILDWGTFGPEIRTQFSTDQNSIGMALYYIPN
jgi:hypothetical protein